jgi:hypothetical protein
LETRCPVVETQCPPAPTKCPPLPTECVVAQTICPPVETRCPVVETVCPAAGTTCPPAHQARDSFSRSAVRASAANWAVNLPAPSAPAPAGCEAGTTQCPQLAASPGGLSHRAPAMSGTLAALAPSGVDQSQAALPVAGFGVFVHCAAGPAEPASPGQRLAQWLELAAKGTLPEAGLGPPAAGTGPPTGATDQVSPSLMPQMASGNPGPPALRV